MADEPDGAEAARNRGAESFEAFRSVDLDGDGVPDKPRARTATKDAGLAVKDVVSDAFGGFFRRGRSEGGVLEAGGAAPADDRA